MKKENFVESSGENKDTLGTMLAEHDGDGNSHALLREIIGMDIADHEELDTHIQDGERDKWDAAAEKMEELGDVSLIVQNAKNARDGAETALREAKEVFSSVNNKCVEASGYAAQSMASEENAGSYADQAYGYMNSARAEAECAKREAAAANSERMSARLYSGKASESAGMAANCAVRAEDAAKRALLSSGFVAGFSVESVGELEELRLQGKVSSGVVYTVREQMPLSYTAPCMKLTGKFSDFFVYDHDDYETGKKRYVFTERILEYGAYMDVYDAEHMGGYVYNADGTYVGYVGYAIATSSPMDSLHGFDPDNEDAEISFLLSQASDLTAKEGESTTKHCYWDGTEWVEFVTAEQQKLLEVYGAVVKPSDSSLFLFAELEDGTYAVAAGNKKISGDIVIPYEYNGKPVTAINNAQDWESFRDCVNITSVTLPNTITLIGRSAFQECTFSEITIPGSVEQISNYAFYQCRDLSEVVIKEGVQTIQYAAFMGCYNVLHIEIPRSVTTLGDKSFDGTTTSEHVSAGNKKKIYYAGSYAQFQALGKKETMDELVWNADLYCLYSDESALEKKIQKNSTGLSELKAAFSDGSKIHEYILYSGQTFEIKPNSIFVAFPPDKTMEMYKADGTQIVSGAGIIGAVCSEVNSDDDMFRACTLYSQTGVLMSDYEASYFYLKEGAYIKYTGSSDYARVLCNAHVGE